MGSKASICPLAAVSASISASGHWTASSTSLWSRGFRLCGRSDKSVLIRLGGASGWPLQLFLDLLDALVPLDLLFHLFGCGPVISFRNDRMIGVDASLLVEKRLEFPDQLVSRGFVHAVDSNEGPDPVAERVIFVGEQVIDDRLPGRSQKRQYRRQ